MSNKKILQKARELINAESVAIQKISSKLDGDYLKIAALISEENANVLVTGAGTSGTVAKRLAHLFATCGLRSFFVDPCEALHGASGLMGKDDILIVFSKAGSSQEINELIRIARNRLCKVIGFTWNLDSEMASLCDFTVDVESGTAAEGEGILPFGSTLAAGAAADALCYMVLKLRKYDLGNLTTTHPSGATKKLLDN